MPSGIFGYALTDTEPSRCHMPMIASGSDREIPIELNHISDLVPLNATTTSANPEQVYEDLRAKWGNIAPIEIEPGVRGWLVLGHHQNVALMREESLFSRDPRDWRLNRQSLLPPNAAIRAYCPPEPRGSSFHHNGETRARLRRPLDDALEALPEKDVIDRTEDMCRHVLDDLDPEGSLDLVADYAGRVGFGSMAALFGFDPKTAMQLRADSAQIMVDYTDQAAPARERMGRTLMGQVVSRRASVGGTDLTTTFVQHPNFRNDREIADSMSVPLIAASEFLTAWIALTLRLLLTDKQFAARWEGGRLALDEGLEEVTRRGTPVPNSCLIRSATRDMVWCGKAIRAGDALVPAMAAANQDPAVHTGDPWDEVADRSHLAWGTGPHRCPARRQAFLITRTAVHRVVHELDLQLAVGVDQIPWASSPWVRQPQSLPVTYQRARTHGIAPALSTQRRV
jgi:cytochrome P450